MLGTVFLTPATDIVIYTVLAYTLVYSVYIVLFKKDFAAISALDLRVSITLLLLVFGYYYGSGVVVEFLWFATHPVVFYLLVSVLVEIIFFLGYRRIVGLSWEDVIKSIEQKGK